MSQPVAWLLLLGGALFVLAGLALFVMSMRPRGTRVQDADPIELPELLEPRTTAIPQIRPAARPPGDLFTPREEDDG
jgi:hypothetical protein